jgi:GAF domain-containing protein
MTAAERLLRSVTETATAVFAAQSSSVLLHDRAAGDMVFAAVAGPGGEELVGQRVPAHAGIAGWVLASGQPLVVEDVGQDPRFAEDTARRLGYVPKGIMAAPLIAGEATLGVLSVLDRPRRAEFSLAELDVLGRLAAQAALALELAQEGGAAEVGSPALERLTRVVDGLPRWRRKSTERLLDALADVLDEDDA